MLGNKFQAFFEHGHHAESQQIDFDDTHVSAIVLIPLHDDAPRHRCWFEWNNGIKLPLADDHPTRMLAQVSGQILNAFAQLPVLSDARMVQVEPNLLKMIFEIVRWTAPFSAVHHARKLVESVLIESKSFAHLSRSRPVPISNDVRRHCGTELPVPLIHVLNRLLSLVSAR